MVGLYYALLMLISAPVYVLAETLRGRGSKLGSAACYAFLFLIVLLFL